MVAITKKVNNTEENAIKTCLAYCRVSDQDQLKGLSLQVQREICIKWAKDNKYNVLAVYVDEAKSGTKTAGRHGLEDALIHCQKEHVDAILVIDTDRFARNEEDHFAIKALLKGLNTKIIAINQPMIDESPEGKLMETFLIGINAFYSRLTGRKVRKSLEKKWNEGWWPGWAPIGYLNVNKGTEERPIRIIELDPNKAPLIKEMFEKYSTGNYSLLKLVNIMYGKGLLAKHGKKLSVETAQQVLCNPFYYGLMRWSGMQKTGRHDPLINEALFKQCQYIASKHRNFLIRVRKHAFLLRGFAYCPIHNRRLTAEWHDYHNPHYKKPRIGYYHCTNVGGCPKTYIEVAKLEKMVAKRIKRYQFSDKFINLVIGAVKRQIKENRESIDSTRQGLINQKKAVEVKRNQLENLLIDGTIDRNVFKRQHEQLEDQITQIDIRISNLQSEYNLDINLIEEVLALTRNIYQTYLDSPDFLKRYYLRFFFERIDFYNGKITKIAETPIFSTLRKENYLLIRSNWLPLAYKLRNWFATNQNDFQLAYLTPSS